MKRAASGERNAVICAAFADGATAKDLAAEHGVSLGQIYMIIRRGAAAAAAPRVAKAEKAVRDALDPAKTATEVAEESGASVAYVYAVAVRAGITLRPPRETLASLIRPLLAAGLPLKDVAERSGATYHRVLAVSRDEGHRPVRRRRGSPVASAVRAAIAAGQTPRQAAASVGCSEGYAYRFAARGATA